MKPRASLSSVQTQQKSENSIIIRLPLLSWDNASRSKNKNPKTAGIAFMKPTKWGRSSSGHTFAELLHKIWIMEG